MFPQISMSTIDCSAAAAVPAAIDYQRKTNAYLSKWKVRQLYCDSGYADIIMEYVYGVVNQVTSHANYFLIRTFDNLQPTLIIVLCLAILRLLIPVFPLLTLSHNGIKSSLWPLAM